MQWSSEQEKQRVQSAVGRALKDEGIGKISKLFEDIESDFKARFPNAKLVGVGHIAYGDIYFHTEGTSGDKRMCTVRYHAKGARFVEAMYSNVVVLDVEEWRQRSRNRRLAGSSTL